MGVPVITLAGDRHLSRVSLSILEQVGLSDLVANTEYEHIEKAISLCGDAAVLSSLRSSLRADMQASSLCNGQEFTRSLETAYRHMWDQ